ncbi:hypothetical protein [Ktedonobacter racemifer]|uniref:Uncharacterized protein n=1 Tax=Ktedonobacter racemifer DSM 44963 TaxID=485913 RepID=D6U8R9_KTERA|nr:hypothetical protein [Ktedonobacter racemifer]EFH79629.1 hypothetical protein Krac_0107 [Ktedonobacter racemifer DSM 44963]
MQQENHQPSTARECAKDFIRHYVIEGWTREELAGGHMTTHQPTYDAQIGAQGGKVQDQEDRTRTIRPDQMLVTRVGDTRCFVLFDLADLIAEIRDEQRGFYRQSLNLFNIQEPEPEPEPPTSQPEDTGQGTLLDLFRNEEAQQEPSKRKRRQYTIYRSYYAGACQNPECTVDIGLIETEGGRDRRYCSDKCRVAHHRQRQREAKREETLRYHGELRAYWQLHNIRGEVLARLQEILLQHGKKAARAATDAVLVALAAQQEAGSQEQFRLIDEVLSRGEAIGYPEIRHDDFRVPAGFEGWTNIVGNATLNFLRDLKLYLWDLQQREAQREQARRKMEELSRPYQQPDNQG